MRRHLRQFVFSGILTNHAVRDMEATGILRRPEATPSERDDSDLFAPVQEHIRSGSLQMRRVYRILYVMENIVRDLIGSTLSDADGPNWFEKRATAPMKREVERRKAAEEKNQWHTGRNREPLYYLDFGDLARLITNHWDEFSLLPSQTWVQSRLDEAERSRNVVAHNNLLSDEEVVRLEMYLRDWIRQIG